jgi:hypothetical protein
MERGRRTGEGGRTKELHPCSQPLGCNKTESHYCPSLLSLDSSRLEIKFPKTPPSIQNATSSHYVKTQSRERGSLGDDGDGTTVGLDLDLGAAGDVAGLDDDGVGGEAALGEDLAVALFGGGREVREREKWGCEVGGRSGGMGGGVGVA